MLRDLPASFARKVCAMTSQYLFARYVVMHRDEITFSFQTLSDTARVARRPIRKKDAIVSSISAMPMW